MIAWIKMTAHKFGPAAIEDFHLMNKQAFMHTVLPFLNESIATGMPVVVHCSGGSGRTGHVLAGWLVHGRGYEAMAALESIVGMGRDPYEAVNADNASMDDLLEFLKPSPQPESD